MDADPSVVAALRAALEHSPDDRALRLHLARLLVDSDPSAALAECRHVLADAPDDVEAVTLAAQAATTVDPALAERYHRLATALGASPPASPPAPAPAAAPADQGDPPWARVAATGPAADETVTLDDEAAIDAFLSDVFDDVEAPSLRLADVAGADAAKKRIETSFLGPLRNPKLRKLYGKTLRGGLLLYGPPGCGKTFLARAVAGEMGAHFLSVGLNDVLDMWLGASEHNLHATFEAARRKAPCVLFLDEVDALGQKRSHLSHSAGRNVVVQLLTELDGLGEDNDGIYVLGATNAPWDVDPALRRPGRFDRTVLVLPPEEAARRAILEFHLRDRPVGKVDLRRLAAATDGWSGADLRLLCDAATERAIERSITSGDAHPIDADDFEHARAGLRASTGAWFEVARNVALFGNEHGEYDDLLDYLRRRRLI